MSDANLQARYFTGYTDVAPPLKLTNELATGSMDNRMTYFVGYFDTEQHLRTIEKVVYGEKEDC